MRPEGRTEREYVREPSLTWAMGIAMAALLIIGMLPYRAMTMAQTAGAGVRTAVASRHVAHELPAKAEPAAAAQK